MLLDQGAVAHERTLATAADLVRELARGYTRGHGFDPDGHPLDTAADLHAVIRLAAGRLAHNPRHIRQETQGEHTIQATVFNGWTVAEQIVLNRYRRRAA